MMSKKPARIEGDQFVWSCDNGHTTDTPMKSVICSVLVKEKTVLLCHHPDCDRVFKLSDEFESDIKKAIAATDPDE